MTKKQLKQIQSSLEAANKVKQFINRTDIEIVMKGDVGGSFPDCYGNKISYLNKHIGSNLQYLDNVIMDLQYIISAEACKKHNIPMN